MRTFTSYQPVDDRPFQNGDHSINLDAVLIIAIVTPRPRARVYYHVIYTLRLYDTKVDHLFHMVHTLAQDYDESNHCGRFFKVDNHQMHVEKLPSLDFI